MKVVSTMTPEEEAEWTRKAAAGRLFSRVIYPSGETRTCECGERFVARHYAQRARCFDCQPSVPMTREALLAFIDTFHARHDCWPTKYQIASNFDVSRQAIDQAFARWRIRR